MTSLINEISTATVPQLTYDSCVISKKVNDVSFEVESLIKPVKGSSNPKNILNFKFKFHLFDNYKKIQNSGTWFNNEILNKFLKFKTIICLDEQEAKRLSEDPLSAVALENYRTHTFSFQNFKKVIEDKKANLTKFVIEFENNIYKEKIEDILHLSVVFLSYYDSLEICKEYGLDLNNSLGTEEYFVGTPEIQRIINNRKIERDIANTVVDTTILTNIPEYIYDSNLSETKKANLDYFSDFFAAYDNENLLLKRRKKSKEVEYYEIADQEVSNVVKFGFFFDIKRFLKENSIIGKLAELATVNNTSITNSSFILNAKLSRINEVPNKYGDYEEKVILEGVTAKEVNYNQLHASIINNAPELVFFSGMDTTFKNITNGRYKYKFSIEIVDPAYAILQKINDYLLKSYNYLKAYQKISSIPYLQAENVYDENPHIDVASEYIFKETNLANLKEGFYIASENRFSSGLQDIFSSEEAVKNILGFLRTYVIFLDTDKIKKDKIDLQEHIERLASSIYYGIKPETGNPEGVEGFLKLYEQLFENINKILSTKSINPNNGLSELPASYNSSSPSLNSVPNFIQTIKTEVVFNNFIADATTTNCFGLDFFNKNQSKSYGLSSVLDSEIQNTKFNQFLKYITYKDFNKQLYKLDLQKINELEAVKQSNEVKYSAYASVDFLLSLYGKKEFEAYLYSLKEENLISTKGVAALKKIASDLTILQLNDISTSTLFDEFFIQNAIDEKTKNLYGEDRAEAILSELLYFIDSGVLYKLTAGILNDSTTIGDETNKSVKTIFEAKLSYYSNQENFSSGESPLFLPANSEFSTINLRKTSKFKLMYETVREVEKISFKKHKGVYILKDPVYTRFSNDEKNGNYLCFLRPYVNDKAFLTSPTYGNVPVHNQHFIYSHSKGAVVDQTTPIDIVAIVEKPSITFYAVEPSKPYLVPVLNTAITRNVKLNNFLSFTGVPEYGQIADETKDSSGYTPSMLGLLKQQFENAIYLTFEKDGNITAPFLGTKFKKGDPLVYLYLVPTMPQSQLANVGDFSKIDYFKNSKGKLEPGAWLTIRAESDGEVTDIFTNPDKIFEEIDIRYELGDQADQYTDARFYKVPSVLDRVGVKGFRGTQNENVLIVSYKTQ